MNFVTYHPTGPLADYVELLWFYKRERSDHAKERLLPTGTMELVVDLTNPTAGPLLSGVRSEYFAIDTSQPASILGVHFRPGGSFPFLGLPAGELHNACVGLEVLWGHHASLLQERLLAAQTPNNMFRILERALLEQALKKRSLERDPAVALALREFQSGPLSRTVSDVIDDTGFSPRHFIQRFSNQVGLTPKLFCRIQRFQRVLRQTAKARSVNWAQVALACGYYDQAHFINDFRAFSGLNPTAYFQIRGEHLNHIPLAE